MEIILPIVAIGSLFVITKKANKTKRETFAGMGKQSNYLPNTHIPPQNFPVQNVNDMLDTVQEYDSPNVASNTYLNQNEYEKSMQQGNHTSAASSQIQQVYSMTGDFLNSDQFKHTNMNPLNGGKIKGNTYSMNSHESVLDNMVGSGTQVNRKIEQAPLFRPEDSVQWTHGMPNQTDFMQSRVNPGMKVNNVKPFESVTVGPGLNQGYGTCGSNGFNSGMEARDLWLPKTVDQLRVTTNPKSEYGLLGYEGAPAAHIQATPNEAFQGRVEKQRPDTFFINSQDRWLTTTGAEKGETLRPIQEMGIIRRADGGIDYVGPAGPADVKAGIAPENFEPTRREQLPCIDTHVRPSNASGHGPNQGHNVLKSQTNYENNRSMSNQPDTMRSSFSGAIGAVIAPFMDMLRPTRSEETSCNVRIYGTNGTTVPQGYVINPLDATPTTIKETTLFSPNFNINNQREGVYVNNYTAPEQTLRNTTNTEYFTAAGGASTRYGDVNNVGAYNQHNNEIKSATIANRPNQGGTQIFNQQMNLTTERNDSDRMDGRVNPAFSKLSGVPPSSDMYGSMRFPQSYDQNMNCERIQPDILTAFKNNPYTHSLTGSV
jgi:hypothetical protein